MNERLSADEKIRRRADYQNCYRHGRRRHGTFATLHFVTNAFDHPRLGITVTRKVGSAVVRNRLKRRVREIYRRWNERPQLPALDIVFHLKPAARRASFEDLEREVHTLCRKLPRTNDQA